MRSAQRDNSSETKVIRTCMEIKIKMSPSLKKTKNLYNYTKCIISIRPKLVSFHKIKHSDSEMNVYDAQKSDQLLKNISSARFDFLIIFCSISPPHHHFSTTDIQTVGAAMFLAASFFFFFSYSANILNLFFFS